MAHGKPLGGRIGMPELYLALGSDYSSLARPAEAVEAFLQGRSLNPAMPLFYDGLAGAYAAMGQYGRAVTALETEGMLDGFEPATVAGIARMYANLPDASVPI